MLETDDDDFMLFPNSKLSSIFNPLAASDDSNASLVYKAPKQPKPGTEVKASAELSDSVENTKVVKSSQQNTQSSVLLAKVITLWKLDNGKNLPMGKHMIAVITSCTTTTVDLIIYQQKDKILIRETLGKALEFHRYANNFIAFNDRYKQLWNINFDTLGNLEAFIQCVNKYECPLNNHVNKASSKQIESDNIDAKSNANKEKILSRVTKIGQQILPKQVERTKSSDLSESESESSSSGPVPTRPVVAPRKLKRNLNNLEKSLVPLTPETNNLPLNNIYLPQSNNNNMMLNPQNSSLLYAQPVPDLGFGNFIIAQNAELKANLAEINMKLNSMLNTRDQNGNPNGGDVASLQTKVKCQNLKIDNLYSDLQKSQTEMESLRGAYDRECKKISSLEKEVEILKAEASSLREEAKNQETLQHEIEGLNAALRESENTLENYREQLAELDHLRKENEELKAELGKIKMKSEELVKGGERNKEQLDKERVSKIVKESMNEAYREIIGTFEENNAYGFSDIQLTVLEYLKKTTYKLINSLS